jgi:hypothetical protein
LLHFQTKINTLKNNIYHTLKHLFHDMVSLGKSLMPRANMCQIMEIATLFILIIFNYWLFDFWDLFSNLVFLLWIFICFILNYFLKLICLFFLTIPLIGIYFHLIFVWNLVQLLFIAIVFLRFVFKFSALPLNFYLFWIIFLIDFFFYNSTRRYLYSFNFCVKLVQLILIVIF